MSQISRQWFQPGDGIAREVITADIQRYLGRDATVRPGVGTGEYSGVDGYWIKAYRNLTSEMVADLQLDSRRWLQEVQQGRGSPHVRDAAAARHPDKMLVKYQDSQTHQSRQYYGPSTPAVATPETSYTHSSSSSTYSRDPMPGYSGRQPAPAASYANDPEYTYGQPQGYVQQGGYYVPAASAQGYQQPRTTPSASYPYPPPSGGRDPEPQYVDPRDPRGAYPAYAAQPPPAAASSRHEAAYSPSTSTQYTDQYGRAYTVAPPRSSREAYAQQPPSANDSRRRRP
ncbi:MAG: hypothetical protein Q9165_006972 [Trypethelium subeluteriae]